jgi:hypothetical protein
MPTKASITLLLDEKTESLAVLPMGVAQLPLSTEAAVETLSNAMSSAPDRLIWMTGTLTQRRIDFASQLLKRLVQHGKIDQQIEVSCRRRESTQPESAVPIVPATIDFIPIESHSVWKFSSKTSRTVFVNLATLQFNAVPSKAVAVNSSLSALERNLVYWRNGNPLPFRNSLVGTLLRPYMKYQQFFVVASSGTKEDVRGAIWFIERALPLSDDDLLTRQLGHAATTIQIWYRRLRKRRGIVRAQRAIRDLMETEMRSRLSLKEWSDREWGSIEQLFRLFPLQKPKDLRVLRVHSSPKIPRPPPKECADVGVQVVVERSECSKRSVSSSCDLDGGIIAGLEIRIEELQQEVRRLEGLLEQPLNCRWRYLLEKNAELRGRVMELERLDCRIVE